MPMARYDAARRTAKWMAPGLRGSTRYVRLQSGNHDPSLRPVISLHGWSTAAWQEAIAGVVAGHDTTGMPYDALLATGRTVYIPFTGPCFGRTLASMVTPTEVTTLGGTGIEAVGHMISQAEDDGLDFNTVDLIGGSMGACNAINWAKDNPSLVHRIYCYVPAIEFSSLYDLGGGIATSLLYAYGGASKTAFMTNSAARDPYRMDLSSIADKISVVASNPDALIRYAGVASWVAQWDIPLATTSSNHFSLDDAGFDEMSAFKWLA